MDKRYVLKISKITQETDLIRTFRFDFKLKARPGQFIMLSDLENGEKPFSIADCGEDYFEITVKKIGKFTTALFGKSVGDRLSVRGAYGSSFFISSGRVLIVAGGYAAPPVYFLAKRLVEAGANVTLVNGARTKNDLVFSERFKDLPINYFETLDEEKLDFKGTSVDAAKTLLKENNYDFIYASGPDLMMKNLQSHLDKHEYEFLFERYMKCAIGICGQCTLDPIGIRVCVEGPVLGKRFVSQLTEFGNYRRDASGQRIYYAK